MMAHHKPAIALAATLSALCALAMGALVLAADLSNDDRALLGRTTDRTTSTDSRPMSDIGYSDAVKSANDAFDQKFRECGEITGSPSLACRNEARAMRDRAMADIRLPRNPNPGTGEGK
ncbi:MAG: hypothetical protein AABM33_04080 [Pseudomonadota bacterium]